MHTLIATSIGLGLLAVMTFVGRRLGVGPPYVLGCFLGVSCVGALVHGLIGLSHGQTLLTEALVFAGVFGVPAAVAVWLIPSRGRGLGSR